LVCGERVAPLFDDARKARRGRAAREKNGTQEKLTVDSAGDGVVLIGEAPADWSVRPGRGSSTL